MSWQVHHPRPPTSPRIRSGPQAAPPGRLDRAEREEEHQRAQDEGLDEPAPGLDAPDREEDRRERHEDAGDQAGSGSEDATPQLRREPHEHERQPRDRRASRRGVWRPQWRSRGRRGRLEAAHVLLAVVEDGELARSTWRPMRPTIASSASRAAWGVRTKKRRSASATRTAIASAGGEAEASPPIHRHPARFEPDPAPPVRSEPPGDRPGPEPGRIVIGPSPGDQVRHDPRRAERHRPAHVPVAGVEEEVLMTSPAQHGRPVRGHRPEARAELPRSQSAAVGEDVPREPEDVVEVARASSPGRSRRTRRSR